MEVIDFQKAEIKIEYDDVISLLKSFKEIGANVRKNKLKKLNKSDLKFLQNNYPEIEGKNILDWEINYVFCKK